MKKNQSRTYRFILIASLMIVLLACSLGGGSSSNEDQALRDQISALETQNAILQKENAAEDNSNSGEVQAPPPPSGDSAAALEMVAATPEALPTAPVPAGQPIIYEGWAMTVSKEVKVGSGAMDRGQIKIKIYVRNLSDQTRIFRWMDAGITLTDNFEKSYEYINVCEKSSFTPKNLEVAAGKDEELRSTDDSYVCQYNNRFPDFEGPIGLDVDHLIVHFEQFGPFDDVDVVIDL